MTNAYKPRRKALWFRMQHGDAPKPRRFKPIPKVSKGRAVQRRQYSKIVREMKGSPCYCQGMRWASGELICQSLSHSGDEIHHVYGRIKKMLCESPKIYVCSYAHRGIHARPGEARELKLIAGPWNHMPKICQRCYQPLDTKRDLAPGLCDDCTILMER